VRAATWPSYVTDEGVVLVDDMFDPQPTPDILAQVRSITDKPLRYVVNTHQHDDHAGGDLKMLPIAEVIAHRERAEEPRAHQAAVLRGHARAPRSVFRA
jgi:glyoxylase-like metal-dependent hydrolase (beta-lactamase superfamily II)